MDKPVEVSKESKMASCGEFVASLIAGASWFVCALEKGHDKGHRAAGNCFKHGRYFGNEGAVPGCPHWPNCVTNMVVKESKMDAQSTVRYVRVADFPTRDQLHVNGDVGRVIREYTEPASEWSGKPEIPMVVAVNAKWPMPLHLQPHQFEECAAPPVEEVAAPKSMDRSKPAMYKKRPTDPIMAVKWTGTNLAEVRKVFDMGEEYMRDRGCRVGDYVVRVSVGRVNIYPPDYFEGEYEPVEEVVAGPAESTPGPAVRCVWCGWDTVPVESKDHLDTVVWPAMTEHVIKDCVEAPHMKMAARIKELEAQLAAAFPEPKPAMPKQKAADPSVDAVARAIYYAQGWTHWPLDSIDPDRDAYETARKYRAMAVAAIKACRTAPPESKESESL